MYTKKNSVPTGTNVVGESWTRWWNEEAEPPVAEMSRTSPDDYEKMQDLFNKLAKIWYTNLPEVRTAGLDRSAMNTTYRTGWPNKDDAYNTAPALLRDHADPSAAGVAGPRREGANQPPPIP